MGLPANPLDSLIDLLGGPEHVAEMTGRKARLVRQQGGLTGVKWEARNASGVAASATLDLINVHERQMFLNLEKRIAIISEAASAGISLHADCMGIQRLHHIMCVWTQLVLSLCTLSLQVVSVYACHWLYKTCYCTPTYKSSPTNEDIVLTVTLVIACQPRKIPYSNLLFRKTAASNVHCL